MEDLQLRGKWWIASDPNRQIDGVLTSQQFSNPVLNLEGYFWDEPKIILGELEDAKRITLYRADPRTNDHISSTFTIDFVFIGVHFHDQDEIRFESIDVRFSSIDNWIPSRVFDKYSTESKDQIRTISADTDSGFMIYLISENDPIARPRIYVRMKSSDLNKTHLDDYVKIKNYFQDFLSFALARPIYTFSIIGTRSQNNIEIHHTEYSDPFSINRKYYRQLFFFEHIADHFEICLRKWIENEDHLRDVISLYTSIIDSTSIYLQIQFLMITQALEAYHRKTTKNQEISKDKHKARIDAILGSCPLEYKEWLEKKLKYSNEPSFRKRLKELVAKYEQVFPKYVEDRKTFVAKIVDTRNHLTHYDSDLNAYTITDPSELRQYTDKLIGLLEICLLTGIATVYEIKDMYDSLGEPIFKALNTLPTLRSYRGPDGQEFPEDPNLKDICHLAETLRKFYSFPIDSVDDQKLTGEQAVEIIEIVEQHLLRPRAKKPVYRDQRISDPRAIRVKDKEQLIDELLKIAETVLTKYPHLGRPEEAIMKALFMWYGCINIDKVCRHKDIHGIEPTDRINIHKMLLAESNANCWIRKGFTSARFFRQTEDQIALKDTKWIPCDSLYWKS